jgi:DNA polymerase-3 subunit delta'
VPSEVLVPLLGNEAARARLWRAADEGRLHHCFLFEGPEGVGKATTAWQLTLYVNCLAPERPCWTAPGGTLCASCRLIVASAHPDVMLVVPDPERATKIISAAQAREIIAGLQLQRHSARRRVVIIDPADTLTEEAGNILLKTLEEPPAGTQFVLVTSRPGSLLQTVRSRSQRVRFGPVPRAELEAWLTGRGLDPRLAAEAMGSPGTALRLAEGEATERRAVSDALFAVVGQPLHRAFAFCEAAGKKGEGGGGGAALAVDAVEDLLRDVVAVASGRESAVDPARVPVLRVWARAMWPGGIARVASAVGVARERLELNVNGRIVLEALLATLNLELSQARAA